MTEKNNTPIITNPVENTNKNLSKESLDSRLVNAFVAVTSGNKVQTIWEDVFIVKTHNVEENGKKTVIVHDHKPPKIPNSFILKK